MEMIQINLLPREFRRKSGGLSLGKTGYYAIGAVAGIVIMIAVITVYQMFQLRQLDEKMQIARYRTQQLQKDIAVVDGLIDVKEKIMQRMEAVDKLDQHRTVWVRILEDFAQRVPEYTWVSTFDEVATVAKSDKHKKSAKSPAAKTDTTTAKVERFPNTRPIEIQGYSFTLNSLANFMINLMRSHFFSDVEMATVDEVRLQDEQKIYNYKLTATLHYLSDDELKNILENESGPDLLASF